MKLNDVRGKHAGRSALILASGPSAAVVDHRVYRHVVIAVNAGFLHAPKADYFFTCDEGIARNKYWPKVRDSKTMVVRYGIPPDGYCVDGIPNDRFLGYERESTLDMDPNAEKLIVGKSSAHAAAHFAVVLGCSPIYLIGCDCRYRDGNMYAWQSMDMPEGAHESGLPTRYQAEQRRKGIACGPQEYGPAANATSDALLGTFAAEWRKMHEANPDVDIQDASNGALKEMLPQITPEEMMGA